MHEPQLRKLIRPANVDGAPDAARLARGETNLVATGVDTLADAVDPAEAKCAVDAFWPGDAAAARIAFVESDPEFWCIGVMLFQPISPLGWRGEEFWSRFFGCFRRHSKDYSASQASHQPHSIDIDDNLRARNFLLRSVDKHGAQVCVQLLTAGR